MQAYFLRTSKILIITTMMMMTMTVELLCLPKRLSIELNFTARRYDRAVYAVVVCPSVCLSVCHKPMLYQSC